MIRVDIPINDTATPTLNDLQGQLKDKGRLKLAKAMAARMETLTRDHIRKAATSRHRTANRLGATPTNYLAKRADTVETRVNGPYGGINLTVYGDIFQRTDRAVVVSPRNRKWLTIPATAAAYGRRAREIGGLRFIPFKKAAKPTAALVTFEGTGKAKKMTVWYWLKKSVTLPMDPGLLPTREDFTQAAELGAQDFLDAELRRTRGPLG